MSDIKNILGELFNVVIEEIDSNPKFRKKIETVLEGFVSSVTTSEPKASKAKASKAKASEASTSSLPDSTDYVLLYIEQGEAALKETLDPLTGKELNVILKRYGIKGMSSSKVGDRKNSIMNYCINAANHQKDSTPANDQRDDNAEVIESSRNVKQNSIEKELPDPLKIYHDEGSHVLLGVLQELDVDDLKAIIKEYHLDKKKSSTKWKDKSKLTSLIMDKVEYRMSSGIEFLNYEK